VLARGKPELAISIEGGDWQDQAALQVLLNSLVFDMSPADAVASPRWGTRHHLGSFDGRPLHPGNLLLTSRFGREIAEALQRRGHRLETAKEIVGNPVAIRFSPIHDQIEVAADPHRSHHVGAY